MNQPARSVKEITRAIEGITALCLGSADRLMWVEQTDASAFVDGDRLFLPKPTGCHPQEYELLLALALREVSKLWNTQAGALQGADAAVLPFASAVEEVRLKALLSKEFLGAPEIFNRAVGIAGDLFAAKAEAGELGPDVLNALAVWGAGHRALLGTNEAAHTLSKFETLAGANGNTEGLRRAIELAYGGPSTVSSQGAADLGAAIWTALQQPVPPEPPAEPAPEQNAPGKSESAGDEPGDKEGDEAPETDRSEAQSDEARNSEADADESSEAPAEANPEPSGAGHGQPEGDAANDGPNAGQGTPPDQEQGVDPNTSGSGPTEPSASADAESGASKGGAEPTQGEATDGNGGGDAFQGPGSGSEATTSAKGAGAGTGNTREADGNTPDVLSDALAMLRGHEGAKDYSAQAKEMAALAAGGDEPVSEEVIQKLRELLMDAKPDTDAIAACCEVGLATEGGEQDEDLTSVMCAGGGFANPEDVRPAISLEGIPARLVSVLLRKLQDIKRRPFVRASAGPRVAVAHMWRLKALGDVRVFRKKVAASGIDAVVSLMLDRSESMEINGFDQAVEVVHAFLIALQRISGVTTSLDVFPGTLAASQQILAYKQNLHAAVAQLRSIAPGGGTPTGSAMANRLQLLLETRAEKKALIVVTDGQPNRDEVALTSAVIAKAVAAGVEVIGIGIGVDVRHLFPLGVSVNSVSELPDALAMLFQNELAERLAA